MGYDTGFNNGSNRHKYITDEVATGIRKRCTVYERKDFHKLKKKYTDAFGNFDYIVELTDFDYVIENTVLKQELANITKLKVKLDQVNEIQMKERKKAENDDLVETNDREVLNRQLVTGLIRRGFKPKPTDDLWLTNPETLNITTVKKYFLNAALTYQYNRDFDAITRAMKKATASKNQELTEFEIAFTDYDYTKNNHIVLVIPELRFNNRYYGKNLYKIFVPYMTLVMTEVVIACLPQISSFYNCRYRNSKRAKNTIHAQDYASY